MSFTDIFKSSFLHDYSVDISIMSICMYLAMSALLGFYIFLLYRVMTKKSFYNKNFNVSLWVLTVITSAIIITISSNIVLSLGMVGALSIVRYRTAIKDPMDLVFLFWSITEGIVCGAGMANIGFILAIIVTVGIFILDKLPMARALKIMTVSADDYKSEKEIVEAIESLCKYYKLKSRSMSVGQLNLVFEFRCDNELELSEKLVNISGVHSLSTLEHDGEVTF